jgi:hypothetical protein
MPMTATRTDSGGQSMSISASKRSLRLRASAEAFEILRSSGSPRISNAELLKHAVRSNHEPHPRVVREVHQALVEVRAAEVKAPPSALKKISGIFSRKAEPAAPSVEDVVKRFEQAFVRPD